MSQEETSANFFGSCSSDVQSATFGAGAAVGRFWVPTLHLPAGHIYIYIYIYIYILLKNARINYQVCVLNFKNIFYRMIGYWLPVFDVPGIDEVTLFVTTVLVDHRKKGWHSKRTSARSSVWRRESRTSWIYRSDEALCSESVKELPNAAASKSSQSLKSWGRRTQQCYQWPQARKGLVTWTLLCVPGSETKSCANDFGTRNGQHRAYLLIWLQTLCMKLTKKVRLASSGRFHNMDRLFCTRTSQLTCVAFAVRMKRSLLAGGENMDEQRR